MIARSLGLFILCILLAACASTRSAPGTSPRVSGIEPLAIGDSLTVDSAVLNESRRINIFVPTVYGQKIAEPLPVLYMLDGGLDEDFLHIAGLIQVLVSDGSMRPFLLVGIKNTQRRRDLTGPTSNPEDKKIAPVVGGSGAFRAFLRTELMPAVRARYRTTDEAAIIGESLAGLFVVETYFLEPDLFRTGIAIDPSLWWADQELVRSAAARLDATPPGGRMLFLACSNEPIIAKWTEDLARTFESHRAAGAAYQFVPLPAESHGTIYHPAALLALRAVFAPPAAKE